ncbi:hypothetical protein J7337_013072 [Fusarium musae]|uniref:Tc toxin complex TcA C-terminal TcB-binding domain-containing protein n=1 Tax=Fusarium musae TaxID=1042133 RepID=A0A9P8IIG5_9HYPO|nr:hypothetical protein J7337_013072 [Fusarium musae]KAG9494843.1 hypothetical protein J7337_013072 [Fusarium musae]
MTIPCIVGPYTSVNTTLTLLEHQYRIKSDAKGAQDYPQKASDERFQTDQVPITSIAVSHGQQDSGVFNLDFKDERYIPFEGAGAVSRWRLELPTTIKQFDYNTISDIVLHMKYTAIQGGAAFRKAAAESAAAFQKTAAGLSLNEGMFAVLDLPNEFPSEWYRLVTADKTKPSTMPLLSLQDRLPFFTKGKSTKAGSVSVLIESSGIDLEEDITLTAANRLKLKAGTGIGSFQIISEASNSVLLLAPCSKLKNFNNSATNTKLEFKRMIEEDKDAITSVHARRKRPRDSMSDATTQHDGKGKLLDYTKLKRHLIGK